MPIDDKQLRLVVLRYLTAHKADPDPAFALTQPDGTGLLDLCRQAHPDLPEDVEHRLYCAFHELVTQSIIVPGSPDRPFQWPSYRLTTFGRKLVERPIDTIVDSSAYVAQLRARVPRLDPAVAFYAAESLRCMQNHSTVAAAVMLGCCCELTLRDFTDAVAASMSTSIERLRLRSMIATSSDFGSVYQHLWQQLESKLAMCPKALRDQTDRELEERMSANFHFLRRIRDNNARPAVCDFTADEVYSSLLRFPGDAELLYGLAHFLQSSAPGGTPLDRPGASDASRESSAE